MSKTSPTTRTVVPVVVRLAACRPWRGGSAWTNQTSHMTNGLNCLHINTENNK